MTAGDFNIPLSPIDSSSRPKKKKKKSTKKLDQLDLPDFCRVFYPTAVLHVFLSSKWNFLQNRSHFRTHSKF
jgi:hypothetical protein